MEENVYGYVRASTVDQNEDRQLIFMQELSIPPQNLIVEKQSGKNFDRPQYKKLVKRLKPVLCPESDADRGRKKILAKVLIPPELCRYVEQNGGKSTPSDARRTVPAGFCSQFHPVLQIGEI